MVGLPLTGTVGGGGGWQKRRRVESGGGEKGRARGRDKERERGQRKARYGYESHPLWQACACGHQWLISSLSAEGEAVLIMMPHLCSRRWGCADNDATSMQQKQPFGRDWTDRQTDRQAGRQASRQESRHASKPDGWPDGRQAGMKEGCQSTWENNDVNVCAHI